MYKRGEHPESGSPDVLRAPTLHVGLQEEQLPDHRLVQLTLEGPLTRLAHGGGCTCAEELGDHVAGVPIPVLRTHSQHAPLVWGHLRRHRLL